MRLRFRRATRDDVPAVVELLADDVLGSTRERGAIETYLSAFDAMTAEANNQLIVGVDESSTVVATYQITFISGLYLAASRRAQVESVRVAAQLRGQGLGRQMFSDVEARARAAGCSLLQLTMNAARSDSARFYAALGFTGSHIGYKMYLD
ncbi:MAG: GNAT family N-acetyltransferase [Dinoroseobacter sp.]|nr:GNAT family N-acetyltransferase [Dinoroseobacter sp.]